jgi:hypothetical protein
MAETNEPDLADAFPSGVPWNNGSDNGGPHGTRRIRPKLDRLRATDINQLRDMMEGLLYHTHQYTDSATTVVNNSC